MTKDAIGPASERALQGNLHKQADKLARQGKLFVRDRLDLLLDPGSFVEDGLLANALAPADDLPADGVVTGRGLIDGRPVCVMANDPTVKAGSWGARTVEKIVRLTEDALRHELPVVWLVDSAGARITDQVELFPGRRGAGRIFYNQVRLSGRVPQVCCLFGPSAAGGAYIPSFCDLVLMVEGNASMYLGSPRMAEEVIGETVTLEEMGGARMHATVSGCGDNLVSSDAGAIELARLYLSYLPRCFREDPPAVVGWDPPAHPVSAAMVPDDERRGYDMHTVVDGLLDDGSFFEIKPLFAPELIVGFGRLEGNSVGVVANNPAVKGGVLFGDSADKAARFIWLSNAFNVPLVFLADVPGFMIGSQVEREGIIRHGAKMITAVSEATVPKVSVIVRKAYGAGLYAMCGPAFAPDACLALPSAKIAVMGPEAAVNAVFYNRIQAIEDVEQRAAYVDEQRRAYEEDVDLLRLASDLVIDAVVPPEDLRRELVARIGLALGKSRTFTERHNGVPPM
jgi:methylmalonyl-CoA decarboxylase subunit alpha